MTADEYRFLKSFPTFHGTWQLHKPGAYQAALNALDLAPGRVLFVAGSAHDVPGADAVGLPVYWSNRERLPVPAGAPAPIVDAPDLSALPELVGAG